jgi:hypothetical protein
VLTIFTTDVSRLQLDAASTTTLYADDIAIQLQVEEDDHEENRSQDFFQRRKLPQSPTRTLISKDEDAPHRHKRAENYCNRLRVR